MERQELRVRHRKGEWRVLDVTAATASDAANRTRGSC